VELQNTRKKLEKLGFRVCAVSYDSLQILKTFARLKKISYPLLSDPGSKVIEAFGLLLPSDKPGEKPSGLPYPCTIFIDKNGVVTRKIMEKNYWERKSMKSILAGEFKSGPAKKGTAVKAPRLALSYRAVPDSVFPGMRLTLVLDIQLNKKTHVYAPGVKGGYIPVRFSLDSSAAYKIKDPVYPKPETVFLKAIKETTLVYHGRFRVLQDIVIRHEKKLRKIDPALDSIAVSGKFFFQACDDKVCYLPEKLPVRMTLPLLKNDWTRIKTIP
jgi:hypothetical protein